MKTIAALCAAFVGTALIAAPNPTGMSGTLADGSSITISGSAFGGGPDVLVFDDFENGTPGAGITLGSGGAIVGAWGSYGDSGACDSQQQGQHPRYSTQHPKSGSKTWQFNGPGSCFRNGLVLHNIDTNEIFFHQWVYIPTGTCIPGGSPTCGGANWKTNWLLGPGKSTVNGDRYPFVTDGGSTNRFGSNASTTSHYYGGGFNLALGTHLLWQFYLYADSSSGIGNVHAGGIDNSGGWEQWLNKTNVDVQSSGSWSGIYHYLDMGGYGKGNSHPLEAFYDDVYAARGPNARARVEITNSSSRQSSSNLTLCTTGGAGDSWTSSSITCTVRGGSFNAGNTVYIWVHDGSGAVSGPLGPYQWGGVQTAACSDGVDNDGDGQTDFPSDPGCSSASDDDEADGPPPSPTIRRGDTQAADPLRSRPGQAP